MALWKTKPVLRLFVPTVVRVGEPFVATLEIEAHEPVEVEWLDLTLQSIEGWSVGSGKSRVSRHHRYPAMVARVLGETELSGTTRHMVQLAIPLELPPSHEGGAAYVRHSLHAHASIPWWPDARVSWPIAVRAPAVEAPASPAVLAAGDAGLFEVSLESQRIATEGIVGGLVALKRRWDGPPTVDVTLREVLKLVSWNGFERVRHGRSFSVPVTLAAELGAKAPFRFRFADVPPTFRAKTFAHGWELVFAPRHGGLFAAIQGAFGSNELRLPIEMVESPRLAALSETLVAPSIGDSRMQELMAAVASSHLGWHLEGLGLSRTLESPHGPIDARIEWAAREEGTFLCAVIEPPALGLGLQVGTASLFDALVADVHVGLAGWDAARTVEAREAAQAQAFLAPLVALAGALLVAASDESLELERADPSVTTDSLEGFLAAIDAVLGALPGALAAIPPPAGTSTDRLEAARIARLARGSFHPGDLAIRGSLEDRSFESVVLFEGARPVAQRITVRPVPDGTLHLGPRRDASSLASLPESARPLAASIPAGVSVAIDRGVAQAFIAAPAQGAFGIDHERAWSLAGMLVLLARSFAPEQGPFR